MEIDVSQPYDLPFEVLKLSSSVESVGALCLPYQIFLAAVALDSNQRLISRDWFVFYNNRTTPDLSLRLIRKNTRKTECGWSLIVDFNRAISEISEIALIVTMKISGNENIDFSLLDDARIVMHDFLSGDIVAQYDLDDEFYEYSHLEFARFVRKKNGWHIVTDVNASRHDLVSVVGELL